MVNCSLIIISDLCGDGFFWGCVVVGDISIFRIQNMGKFNIECRYRNLLYFEEGQY